MRTISDCVWSSPELVLPMLLRNNIAATVTLERSTSGWCRSESTMTSVWRWHKRCDQCRLAHAFPTLRHALGAAIVTTVLLGPSSGDSLQLADSTAEIEALDPGTTMEAHPKKSCIL
jgi:hypothetical protein